jgi:Zn-dependent protease
MNVALGLLNLLPAAPLDGGHVCEAIVWRLTGSRRRGMRVTAVLGYVLGSLMFMSGLGDLGTVTGAWLALLGFILMTNAVSLWAASRVLRS